jgi:hypothetical protein
MAGKRVEASIRGQRLVAEQFMLVEIECWPWYTSLISVYCLAYLRFFYLSALIRLVIITKNHQHHGEILQ